MPKYEIDIKEKSSGSAAWGWIVFGLILFVLFAK